MWNSSPHHSKLSSLSSGAAAAAAPSDAGASSISLTSTAWRAQPTLIKDSNHKPKTYGSLGILVVGLGGANGSTLLAGILANRLNIEWRGPQGEPMTPNYNGCITQLDRKGNNGSSSSSSSTPAVGYQDVVKGLADASMAAVGGWDIRDTKLGDALLEAHILDYDLVRQVQPEMNQVKIFRGLFDPRFIVANSSQQQQQQFDDNATYILTEQEARSDAEALKCLRADIRYFKWRNGVVGHMTVIWSATVEPNSTLIPRIRTATELLESMEMTEEERGGPLPPSLLYATAALLEGCSFVNGGSQNTLDCPGLAQLAEQQLGVYCLGTDFKAGQSRFKTAAVEYLRTSGLSPKVIIASSNHPSNNDNNNDGSAPYNPYTQEDNRDFGEYTSVGFLGQPHTIVTYTRASDSVLCAPLIIDAAVWCDYFSQRSWSHEKVAKALAYLFQVPEGAAKGVDPGFFRQMEELKLQILAAHESSSSSSSRTIQNNKNKNGKMGSRRVRIREGGQTAATEWAIPGDAGVICVGLACLDRQLNCATTGGNGGEGIETFQGETSVGGGR
jgi:myo-inositol-1-phosphate synthase